ncbi:hypothetical protein [Rubrivirga sp. IMCC45206]|uniref:hypothetical protein n=1 Tax=Rubrivirga sp. IMCC45206 TaxID=3391614 RepID=UPI00398FDABA
MALLALMAVSAAAQPAPADLLRAMEDAVARLDSEAAEARAREALALDLSPDQLVTVHTTLGVLLHARGEPVEARRQFEAALSLDPALALDPVLVSPKTVEFFDEIQAKFAAPQAGPVVPTIRYVVLEDRRPGAALRSLALPGWGQFHKGDRAKGWAFALAAGASLAATGAASAARASARDAYLAAVTPADAERLYPAYDRWHRTRAALAVGTAAVWAAAALDALATGAPSPPASVRPTPQGLALRVRL